MRRSRKADDASTGGAGDTAVGVVTFFTAAAIATYLFFTNGDMKASQEAYWLINNGLCFWVPLVVILLFLRRDPAEFGLQLGDSRTGFKWSLLLWIGMLLPALGASFMPAFHTAYVNNRLSVWMAGLGPPFNPFTHLINYKALLYYELAMGFYMFCWEFFFRGFLLFGLQKTRLGSIGAIIIQTIPFVLLHWSLSPGASKPVDEIIGSAIAGPILGILAVRTGSCIYGFVAHWAVSVTFDLFILAPFMFRHFG